MGPAPRPRGVIEAEHNQFHRACRLSQVVQPDTILGGVAQVEGRKREEGWGRDM